MGLPESPSEADPSLVRQLVSVAAAYAICCTTSLQAHVAAARALGATDRQILAALEIACGIKEVAGRKIRASAGAVLGEREAEAGGCDCGEGGSPEPEGGPRSAGEAEPEERATGVGSCSCAGENSCPTRKEGT